ncbi:MAG: hypothetical protein K6G83_08490 [Lachnospiraceae bacterium]|nr:hypothetical protein [Lachnospiraceae bacterium]
MDNKNYRGAKILTLIPIVVFALTIICLGALAFDYFSTGSDVTAVALIFTGTLSALFTTLPCLVMSVLGTVLAARAKREGIVQAGRFFVTGIIEIVFYGVGLVGAAAACVITILARIR